MENTMGNVLGREISKSHRSTAVYVSPQTPPRTPSITTTAAHTLAAEIHDIHHALVELPSLSPGEDVNALLTRLVSLCIIPYDQDFVTEFFHVEGIHLLCSQLRPLCATAEGELESYWAQKIISESLVSQASATQTRALLSTFPYHQNYIDLSRIECSTLSAFLPTHSQPLNIAFVGSGPLPLTSLCMLDIFPSAHVHNVDRNLSALSISQELTEKMGYSDRMSFVCADVSAEAGESEQATKWQGFDVVFLAALVGMDTTSKLAILESLVRKLRPGTLVATRSAKGLRGVLYPILELGESLERIGLEMLVELHPWTKVVNSVIILRVKDR